MGMFSEIMRARRTPEAVGQREEVAEIAGWIYTGCGLTGAVTAIAGAANFVAQRSFPWLTFFSVATLALREATVVFWNVENVMSDSETEGWTGELVSHRVTENTWLVGSLFRKTIERELKSN